MAGLGALQDPGAFLLKGAGAARRSEPTVSGLLKWGQEQSRPVWEPLMDLATAGDKLM